MRLYCWEMSMFSSFKLPRTSLFVCIFLQFEFDEYTFSTNSLEFCIRGGSSTSPSSNAVWDKTKTAPIFFCCSKRNAKVATNMTFMIGSAFETLKEPMHADQEHSIWEKCVLRWRLFLNFLNCAATLVDHGILGDLADRFQGDAPPSPTGTLHGRRYTSTI